MLALFTGELNFLTNRKGEASRLHGGTHCLVKVCCEEDTLQHVAECFGYTTRYDSRSGSLKQMAEYLTELNKERTQKFGVPLIYFRE